MNKLAVMILTGSVLVGGLASAASAGDEQTGSVSGGVAQKAFELRRAGDTDGARRILEEELKAHPDDGPAWFELARAEFYRAGKTQEMDTAQRAIEKALELDPDDVRYLTFAGVTAVYNTILKVHAGKTDEMPAQMKKAVSALEKAVAIDPACDEARFLLVCCYGNNPPELGGDQDKAEKHLEMLEKDSPVLGTEARCEVSEKKLDRVEIWKDLAEKLQDNAQVFEHLAAEYARAGKVEQALECVDKTLALDRTRGHVLLDVALILASEGNAEPSEKLLERYLACDPAPPAALTAYAQMCLGRVQKMLGKDELSVATLEQARETDPYCWFTMKPPPECLFESL